MWKQHNKKKTKSAAATPFKRTESIYNVSFYNTISHQIVYSEEVLMQKVSKNWERFNSQIRDWQSKRDYKKLNNKVHSKRLAQNLRIPENSLKAK